MLYIYIYLVFITHVSCKYYINISCNIYYPIGDVLGDDWYILREGKEHMFTDIYIYIHICIYIYTYMYLHILYVYQQTCVLSLFVKRYLIFAIV